MNLTIASVGSIADALGIDVVGLVGTPSKQKASGLRPGEAKLLGMVRGLDDGELAEVVRAVPGVASGDATARETGQEEQDPGEARSVTAWTINVFA